MSASVAFVGSGPGDPGLLTVRARDLLRKADAVVLDHLVGEEFVRAVAGDRPEIVHAVPTDSTARSTPSARARVIVRTAKAAAKETGHALVVRLMDGDPAFYNGLAEEAVALTKAELPFEIVPGVSAASAVPTYAGVPLTQSNSRGVQVFAASDARADLGAALHKDVTAVVVGATGQVRDALVKLRAAGRDETTPVSLTLEGTTIRQRTEVFDLADVESAFKPLDADPFCVAVAGAPVEHRGHLSWWETKPLFGWNVLVPRTKDQAGPMVNRLADHGATSSIVPTISVEPPRTPQQMERAIKGLVTGRYEWIGFTSANAVRAVREKFEEYGLDARAFAGLKIAAVGGVTANKLREWGLYPDLVPSGEQSARGLLEDWPDYDELLDPINRVFLPRADIATDTLVAGLQEIGWEVDDVTAYRTVRAAPPAPEVREAIKTGKFDAVCFTSSSTVRNLVGIAGKPHATTVVACIGPATAKTAEEHGLRVDVMAPEPSAEALVDALAEYGRGLQAAAAETGEPLRRPSQRRTTGRRRAKA